MLRFNRPSIRHAQQSMDDWSDFNHDSYGIGGQSVSKSAWLANFTATQNPRYVVKQDGTFADFHDGRNIILASEDFSAGGKTITPAGMTLTANAATAPGNIAMTKLGATGTATAHYVQLPSGTAAYVLQTLSVVAKAVELPWLAFNNNAMTYFNLATGALGTVGSGHSASIVALGNGYYRCSITFLSASTTTRVYMASSGSTSTVTATAGQGILIGGLMLNNGAILPYERTTIVTGVRSEPAISYRFGRRQYRSFYTTSANLQRYASTEDFTQAAWVKSGLTVTADAVAAPNGAITADKLVESATTAVHTIGQSVTKSSATGASVSFFAKPAGRTWVYIDASAFKAGAVGWFNLTGAGALGTVTNATAEIVALGGFWQVNLFLTGVASGVTGTALLGLATGDGVTSYAGDGTSGVYAWGANFATELNGGHYAPNQATTGTSTKGLDELRVPPATETAMIAGEWTAVIRGRYQTEKVIFDADETSGGTTCRIEFGTIASDPDNHTIRLTSDTTGSNGANAGSGNALGDFGVAAGIGPVGRSAYLNGGDPFVAPPTLAVQSPVPQKFALSRKLITGGHYDFLGIIRRHVGRDAMKSLAVPATTFAPQRIQPITVNSLWTGDATASSIVVSVRTDKDTTARMVASTSTDLSNPIYGATVATANKLAKLTITAGLSPSTTYYYGVEVGGTLDPMRGKFITAPVVGAVHAYRFSAATCSEVDSNVPVFSAVESLNNEFFWMGGDISYRDIQTHEEREYYTTFDRVFAWPLPASLYRNTSMVYMWDDHDCGGNPASVATPGRPDIVANYRKWVPSPPVPAYSDTTGLTDYTGTYWSKVHGRLRFICVDMRSMLIYSTGYPSAKSQVLGATQLQWLKDQILAAKTAHQPAVLLFPFTIHANFPTSERDDFINYIKSIGMAGSVMMINGDSHQLSMDSGANHDFATGGGCPIPTAVVAPINRYPGGNGGTWDVGYRIPTVDGSNVPLDGHFGSFDVNDTGGSTIPVLCRGWMTTFATSVTTLVMSMTVNLVVP